MKFNNKLAKTLAILSISTISVSAMTPLINIEASETASNVQVKAESGTYASSNQQINETKNIYTLPQQPYKNDGMPRGAGHDRQSLGYIMQPGATLTITNNSDTPITVSLWTNDSKAQPQPTKIGAHQTATITAPNPPVQHTDRSGNPVGAANDVDLVPFINTPEGNNLPNEISVNVELTGPHKKLPTFNYENNNQDEFLKNWSEGDSYALVQGKNFQILLPTDDREYVENMATAPKGTNAKGEPIKVGDGEYVCRNLNDVLHVYDDILFPTYNKLVGLSEDASEQYNKLINYKYFYTADSHGAGAANYSPGRAETSSYRDWEWLQPSWTLFHESGHGYQSTAMRNPDDHTGEVTNNILAGYVFYNILYKDHPELADKYSWFFNGNKEKLETHMNEVLNDPQYNWQWNTLLPAKGLAGFPKHAGLVLLYNMVQKMGFDGWTEMYQMDRAQYFNGTPASPQNLKDLMIIAAQKRGYDYSAITNEIGWLSSDNTDKNSEDARNAKGKDVNFLWYLMPKATYDEVYDVVKKLAADDPNMTFQSNYTLVTPDQMEKLGLKGSTTLEFNDLPNDWIGKTVSLMNGDKVQGQFTIGSDGVAKIVDVPIGTYTIGLPDNGHIVDNYYVTVKYNDPEFKNSTIVMPNPNSSSSSLSSSSSSSKSSSSSIKSSSSSVKSSSLESSSSKKSSSSSVKSSSVESSSSSKKSSSSSVKSSSVESSSSKKSSSSSMKSSSLESSSSSKKSSSSSVKSSSVESSSSKKSSSSSEKSSSVENSSSKKSSSSSVKSSSVGNSSSKKSSSSSVKNSSVESSSSKKSSLSIKSSSVESSSSKKPSSSIKSSSIESLNSKHSSSKESSVIVPSKPDTNTPSKESSVIVPSKPDANTSSNGNGAIVPSKPDANTSSNGNGAIVPSKPDANTSSNGNGAIVPSKPDANTSSNGNGTIVPSKPDANTSSNGNGTVAPVKPDANASSKGNGAIVPSKPDANTSSNGNGAIVPSKPDANASSNDNGTVAPSKPDTNTPSNGNDEIVPSKPGSNTPSNGNNVIVPSKLSTISSSNGNSTLVSSKTSTNSSNEKQMNDTSNNLKAKNGKELPQTGDASHAVAVIMGAITLGIAGIISFFKRNDD